MVGEERISKIQHSLCRLVLDLAESSEDLMLVPQVKEKMRSSGKKSSDTDAASKLIGGQTLKQHPSETPRFPPDKEYGRGNRW